MADLSLDEIIATTKRGRNFKVQFSRQNAGKQFQEKTKGIKPSITSRLYSNQPAGTARWKTFQSHHSGFGGPGKGQIDARDMITIKNRIKMPDARVKLVQKRINQRTFDARSKLKSQTTLRLRPAGPFIGLQQQLPFQQTFGPANQKIFHSSQQQRSSQENPGTGFYRSTQPHFQQTHDQDQSDNFVNFNVAVNAGMSAESAGCLTRTLRNPLANGGSVVEVTGSSLKITRSIPDVTFDGQNLTVTRRLPQSSKNQDSSSSSSVTGSGPRARMDNTRGPVIQFQNDKFQPVPLQTSAPGNRIRIRQESGKDRQKVRAPSPIQAPISKRLPVKDPSPVRNSSAEPSLVSSSEFITETRYKIRKNVPAATPSTQEPNVPNAKLRLPPSTSSSSSAAKRPALSDRQAHSGSVSSRLSASGVLSSKRLAPRPSARSEASEEKRIPGASRVGAKRKAPITPMTLSERFASRESSSSPVIVEPVPVKKRRVPLSEPEPEKEDHEELEVKERSEEDEDDVEESGITLLSPLQGFRILVSNLHSTVTQDDIIELFGAIGPLKRANMLSKSQAEVAFIHKEHAVVALKKYHNRELDGQPMFVKLTTPLNAKVMEIPSSEDSPGLPASLRSSKKPLTTSAAPVEIPLIHKALFKTGTDSGPSKSVRFTVKL